MHNGPSSCVSMDEVVFVLHCHRETAPFLLGLGVGLLLSFIPFGWFLRLLVAAALILLALLIYER